MYLNRIASDDSYSYVVDKNGIATRLNANGWTKANGKWYYCEKGKAIRRQVRKLGGKYYGFDSEGAMYTDTRFSISDGDIGLETKYYHAKADGVLSTNAWVEFYDWGQWSYYGSDARAYTNGWYSIGGKAYYFDEDGWWQENKTAKAGWQKSGSSWVYMKSNGSLATGWQKISSKWYYFNSAGTMQTGWKKLDGKWYYFESSGVMLTGWQKLSGTWYYFNSSGAMLTGWQKLGGVWYYFNGSGAMQTGWKKLDGKWYYFESSGAMLANTSKKIGSKTYKFNASGVCTNP